MPFQKVNKQTKSTSLQRLQFREDVKPDNRSFVPVVFGTVEISGVLLEGYIVPKKEQSQSNCSLFQVLDSNSDITNPPAPKLICRRKDIKSSTEKAKDIINSILDFDRLVPKSLPYTNTLEGYTVKNPLQDLLDYTDIGRSTSGNFEIDNAGYRIDEAVDDFTDIFDDWGDPTTLTTSVVQGRQSSFPGAVRLTKLSEYITNAKSYMSKLYETVRKVRLELGDIAATISDEEHESTELRALIQQCLSYLNNAVPYFDALNNVINDYQQLNLWIEDSIGSNSSTYDNRYYNGGITSYASANNLHWLFIAGFGMVTGQPAGSLQGRTITNRKRKTVQDVISADDQYLEMLYYYFLMDIATRSGGWVSTGDVITRRTFGVTVDGVARSMRSAAISIWRTLSRLTDHRQISYKASNLIPVDERAIVERATSGAMGFAVGELDFVHALKVNDILLPQPFPEGIVSVYYPNLFGGLDGGGIGSSHNKNEGRKIGIWYGSQDQDPKHAGIGNNNRTIAIQQADGTSVEVPIKYRGIAHLSWDNYPWGDSDRAPTIKALVQRINKQTDGRPQWQPRYATIDTTT